MIHTLKTWPEPFTATLEGLKTAEYRIDDRDYKVRDELLLEEWVPGECRYTGRKVQVIVTHVVKGPMFGVPEGYVVMSIFFPRLR